MTRLAPRSSSLPDPWRDQITHVVDDVEAESASYNQITAPRQAIFKVAVVLLTTTLALTFIAFFRSGANPAWLITSLDAVGLDGASAWVSNALLGEGNTDFNRLVMFFGVTIVGFLLLPVAAITLILREPLRDYGLRIRGMSNSWRPYALLFAVSVPLIALASLSPDFRPATRTTTSPRARPGGPTSGCGGCSTPFNSPSWSSSSVASWCTGSSCASALPRSS